MLLLTLMDLAAPKLSVEELAQVKASETMMSPLPIPPLVLSETLAVASSAAIVAGLMADAPAGTAPAVM